MEPLTKRAKVDDGPDGSLATEVLTVEWVDVDPNTHGLSVADVVHPTFAHAFFGEEEKIRGYTGLTVRLVVDRLSFYAFLDVAWATRSDDADDVAVQLRERFEYDFLSSEGDLVAASSKFRDELTQEDLFGEAAVAGVPLRDGSLSVRRVGLKDAHPTLKAMHYRLEPFLLFFIDGFQCLDTDDSDWSLFSAVVSHNTGVRWVGYTTVYRLFAFPDGHRDRIGQMFVLPGYQKEGIGRKMLEAVHCVALEQKAVDVSVEEPTEVMQKMKRGYDMERLSKADWIQKLLEHHREEIEQSKSAQQGFLTKDEKKQIHTTFRLPLCDVEPLWSALLLAGAMDDKERLTRITAHLLRRWTALDRPDVRNKVIFQDLDAAGGATDNFVMMPCSYSGAYSVTDGVMVIPTESCATEDAERQRCLQLKCSAALELAAYFDQRQKESTA